MHFVQISIIVHGSLEEIFIHYFNGHYKQVENDQFYYGKVADCSVSWRLDILVILQ